MEISTLPNQIQYPFHCYLREKKIKNILRFAANGKIFLYCLVCRSSSDDSFLLCDFERNRQKSGEWNVIMST